MENFLHFSFYEEPCRTGKSQELPADIFQKFAAQWPQFKPAGQPGIKVNLEEKSPLLGEIFKYLEIMAAKTPHWHRLPHLWDDYNKFQLTGSRSFSLSDISEATFCYCLPKSEITGVANYCKDQTLEVKKKGIKSQPIGYSYPSLTVICKESLKQDLSEQQFRGLQFKPVKIEGEAAIKEPLWQLWSDVTLPSVAQEVVDHDGNPCVQSGNKGCFIDDLYVPQILPYRRKEIADLGDFDVAVTLERWGTGPAHARHPYLVVSQLFRKWCQQKKLKMDWVPIHLVE